MSFNIRNYVSDDHIESIGEIARGQANIIQALSLDNSQKDKEIERLHSIIKEVRECIYHYAIENEDYSKIYNDEEKELLEILDKVGDEV